MTADDLVPFLSSIAIGLLIGLERERSHRADTHQAAGSRTFALLALSGTLAASINTAVVVAGLAAVAALLVVGYVTTSTRDPGATTEVAAVVTFLLGALAWTQTGIAAAIGIAVLVLLMSKRRIHVFAQNVITDSELEDATKFLVMAFYNKIHDVPGTPRNHPHVELSLDASTLHDMPIAIDSNGQIVDPVTTDTMLCHCAIHRIMRDNHAVLAYGRSQHTVSHSLFRSVAARDGGCRFPGCDRPIRFCDAHHIRHWRHGGSTDHDNLLLLCSRHHHHVHRHDLAVKLLPDASAEVTWADGRQRTSRPRGRPPTARAA